MKSFHLLSSSAIAIALVACAPEKNGYDTSNPYGTPAGAYTPAPPVAAVNPTYDTPAAYEDSTAPPAAATTPVVPPTPGPAATGGQAATTHIVVKGDTLGGIATKYKVPMASIMKANNMTKDTVVLGKKLVIPAR